MDLAEIEDVVQTLRASFKKGKTLSKESRHRNLNNLLRLLDDHADDFIDAMHKDFRKPPQEARGYEVDGTKAEITIHLNALDNLMKPKNVNDGSYLLMGKKTFLKPEPYGVVLIIGAWNYPLQLTLYPLVGAIAAGNCAVIKPSEITAEFAAALEKYLPQYLDQDCFRIVNGDKSVAENLLKCRFDYIMYTGNATVGRIIMEAASKHLTPVTLELGGKSPAVVDSRTSLSTAAKRIVWGKYVNDGQTCIAPDYVLCEKKVKDELITEMKRHAALFYGSDPQKSESLGRIINDRHFERVAKLLKDKEKYIVHGGEIDRADRYIAPTILVDVPLDDPLMQEEIFGPLLPVVAVDNLQKALDFINEREKPLVIYTFSDNSAFIDEVVQETSSGAVVVNDTLLHAGIDVLPFGGVGASGMGRYHGLYSFETFSHMKPCFVDPYFKYLDFSLIARYPPYTKQKERIVSLILKKFNKNELRVLFLIKLTLVVALVAVVFKFFQVDEMLGRIIGK